MAAQVFPNTVLVEGFPAGASRHDLLTRFGGPDNHIDEVYFTNVPGESKKAFIHYKFPSGVRHALSFKGASLYQNSSDYLVIRELDEEMLCHVIPGETRDVWEALADLKWVLSSVLASRDQVLFASQTLSDKCSRLQAENNMLSKKVAEMNISLDASLRSNSFLKAERDTLAQNLKDTTNEKNHALERMRAVNDVILQVEVNEHAHKIHTPEPNNGLLSDEIGGRKRQHEENVLEEPIAKRRCILNDQNTQTFEDSVKLERSTEDVKTIQDGKEEAEALLREAHTKLDQAIVADSLLAAFIRMDKFTKRVIEEIDTSGAQMHSANSGV